MKNWLLVSAIIGLGGCSALTSLPQTLSEPLKNQSLEAIRASQPLLSGAPLTLKQIMADPTWMGTAPSRGHWNDDNQSIFYRLKQEGSPFFDYYQQPINVKQAQKLGLDQQHLATQRDSAFNQARSLKAFTFKGNLFVKDLVTADIRQLTRDSQTQSQPLFLNDGRLSYRQGNAFYGLNLTTGLSELLVEVVFATAPSAPKKAMSYIGAQQHRLIKYVALQHHNKALRHQRKTQLNNQNDTLVQPPFYLDPQQLLVALSLSPNGQQLLVVTQDKDYDWRSEHDIMPNYLAATGYVDPVLVRARVAEDNPPDQQFVLIDIANRSQNTIDLSALPGYDQDVLASVKAENAKKRNKKYQSKKSARRITLIEDWGWDQSAIVWNKDGSELAIMFEAIDNKDRWLTRYNFKSAELETLHRLHDDAWVNYTFNEFGWLNDSNKLYYLSEQSGYSQLYVTSLTGQSQALTQGKFEVSNLTQSNDGRFIYYKANKSHPGQYEIYRVETASAKSQALTQLQGVTDYELSPQQDKLLLTHSKLLQHPELYIKELNTERPLMRLTSTVSEEFAQYNWQAPRIVKVPSSHVDAPIYAKIYLPQGFDSAKASSYPAVIFNHGAGYLQNSHYGWSGYYREFMFHNLLAQQGYVVMDMDYRASKGYGRDWRTAIYRQMGTPEVQDLKDGVNYLGRHFQVDIKRVGTYGGSYGGFMTFMALFTEPDLFQAGAALRPVTDWAHYNFGYTSNILNTPNDDDIAYRRSSPIEYAQNLTKPLLIMSGVLDDNVFFQDSVRLVQRLIELEKPMFETAIYPIEPHGFRQPSSWLDEYRRIFKLFEQNLK